MAYYYIKSGGTATGDAGRTTTLRTGSFTAMGASAYYNNISAAVGATTAPVEGDYFLFSNAHSETIDLISTSGVSYVSVSDTNANQASPGAALSGSAAFAINPSTTGIAGAFDGMTLTGAVSGITLRPIAATFTFRNCSLNSGTGSGAISGDQSGCVIVQDCSIVTQSSGNSIGVETSGRYILRINNVDFTGSTTATSLITTNASSQIDIEVTNSDISHASALLASGVILSGVTRARIHRCKLKPLFTAFAVDSVTDMQYIDITESTNPFTGAGWDHDAYHYFYRYTPFGEVEEDTLTYLSATYDGINGFSFAFSTSNLCNFDEPLRYPIGSFPAQNLASAKTVEVQLTGDSGLTDADVWIEVELNDNTDLALGTLQSTQSSTRLSGSNLTTAGTGTWTNGDTEDYIITKDLGAQSNVSNGNVIVYACVGKPSIDVNFDIARVIPT